jgi:hypothetical protein
LLSGFLAKVLYLFIICAIHVTRFAHLIFLGLITLILFGGQSYNSSTQSLTPATAAAAAADTATAAAAAATPTAATTTTTTTVAIPVLGYNDHSYLSFFHRNE